MTTEFEIEQIKQSINRLEPYRAILSTILSMICQQAASFSKAIVGVHVETIAKYKHE